MYREVTMLGAKEVLRLWREGVPTKRVAAQLGLDPQTVRRYLRAAAAAGVRAEGTTVTYDEVREALLALQPAGGRPRGDGWAQCETQPEAIRRWLTDSLRLTKIRKLLLRQGVGIAYPTQYRFAVLELQFGQTATAIPVLDGPRAGAPSRHWLGRLAHGAVATDAASVSRLDSYGGALAASLRLSETHRRYEWDWIPPTGPGVQALSRRGGRAARQNPF